MLCFLSLSLSLSLSVRVSHHETNKAGSFTLLLLSLLFLGVNKQQQQPSGKNQKTIRLREGIDIQPGQDVRQMGSDMALGEVILHEGKLLSAADVGMLASLGIPSVKVFSKPKAAVMSTGDEVYDISNVQQRGGEREKNKTNQKGKHQIFDSNRPILYSLAGR